MKNFSYKNPTRLIFGRSVVERLPRYIKKEEKLLITFGGGSAKRNGVYEAVTEALRGYEYSEFWGIEPNPSVETIRRAVAAARAYGAEHILAVGGGSVVDASKLIAAATKTEADPWEMVRSGHYDVTLPLSVVLTVPATGSEMNRGAVISNRETGEKFSFYSEYPVNSFLDPSYCLSLPIKQIACGWADAWVHTMEQYMTYPQSGIMDRLAEGVLQQIREYALRSLEDELSYDTAAEYMLSATIALNGYLSMGVETDWATHKIGHEITALTGATHAETLTMVHTQLLTELMEEKRSKLLQYAERIWGIEPSTNSAEQAITCTRAFYKELGLPCSMREANVSQETAEEIIRRFYERGTAWGENGIATPERIEKIIRRSMEE